MPSRMADGDDGASGATLQHGDSKAFHAFQKPWSSDDLRSLRRDELGSELHQLAASLFCLPCTSGAWRLLAPLRRKGNEIRRKLPSCHGKS